MKYSAAKLAVILFAAFILSSCGLTQDSSNVALESLGSPEAGTYSPGQPFSVDFSVSAKGRAINSDGDIANHVGVAFFVIEESKAGQLADNQEAEEFEVGEFYIENLVSGTHSYTAELMVPNDLVASTDYRIVAIVDISGVVPIDHNGDDNFSQMDDPTTYGNMDIDLESHHDFILAKIEVGEGFLLLPQPEDHDESESTEPVTMESDLIGFIDAIKHGDDVNSADVIGNFTVAGIDYTAHFWHEEDDEYTDSMEIVFPNHEEEHFFPWDLALNGELVHAMFDAYDESADENTISLTLEIVDTSFSGEESTTNNSQTIEIPYFFFENDTDVAAETASEKTSPDSTTAEAITVNSSSIQLSENYSHTYGDRSKVAISMGFDTDNYVIGTSTRAEGKVSAGGDFTLSIFNQSATLLGSSMEAEVNAVTGGASYEVGVSVLGLSVIDESDSVADRLTKEWERTWDEEQTLFSTTFVIAIVPLSVSAGIEGSIGIGAELGFDNAVITATGTVFSASLGAFAEASINLLIASGGVRAEFTIVEDSFDITGTIDLSEWISRELSVGIDITNELKAIEGEFYLFVRYPGYKFCCRFPTKEARKTIYNTGALYDKTWTFLSASRTLNF